MPPTRHKAAQLVDVRAVHALVPELLDRTAADTLLDQAGEGKRVRCMP